MSKILLSGSIAYDNIMLTNTNIKDNISVHNDYGVNFSYEISDLRKEKGGTGLNISYNIALLGGEPVLLSSVGMDFTFSDFVNDFINIDNVHISSDKLTANYYITSDKSGNKLNAFYPGAICDGCKIDYKKQKENIEYAIVSADYIPNMLKNIVLFKKQGYKVFLNPGYQVNQMSKEELLTCMDNSDYLIMNYSEYETIKYKSQYSDEDMISNFEKIIITYGIRGSKIFDKNYNMTEVFGVENPDAVDFVGAGDAYVGGLVFGISEGFSWETSAQIGSVLSSISVGTYGGQNHEIDWDTFKKLFEDTFGEKLDNTKKEN